MPGASTHHPIGTEFIVLVVARNIIPNIALAILISLFVSILSPASSSDPIVCGPDPLEPFVPLKSKQGTLSSALNRTGSGKTALKPVLIRFERLSHALNESEPKTGGAWLCADSNSGFDYELSERKLRDGMGSPQKLCILHPCR